MAGTNNYGGGFVQGETATYETCQGASGEPTSVGTWGGGKVACTIYNNGLGSIRIEGPGAAPFANCVDGTLVYIDFFDTYADDWYVVLAHTDTTIDIGEPYESGTDCDCNVGGAFLADGTGIATALSLVAAGDEVHIASDTVSGTDYDVAATITLPAVTGTSANKIIIRGVDYADGGDLSVSESRPTWNAVAGLGATPILLIDSGTPEYYKWKDLVLDGNDIANHCVYNSVTATNYHAFDNCRFRQATDRGFNWHATSSYLAMTDCEFDNNGGYGCNSGSHSLLEFCSFHDNDGLGVYPGYSSTIAYCKVYGNGDYGIHLSFRSSVINCTVYGNVSDGLYSSNTRYWNIIANSSFCNNGGYGINLNGITTSLIYLSNNHSNGNTTAHYSEGVDGTWADFMDGDNISGDPKCVDAANGNFDPLYNSPLLGAGVNDSTIGAGSHDGGWPEDRPDGLIGEPITGTFI